MGHRILIVDDSATMRTMIRRLIGVARLNATEIYEAANGIEALAHLNDHDIDVMIVDINMPAMNGVQLLQRMKSFEHLKKIPIVIASTEGSQQRIKELTEIGASAYLRKPFQPERLRAVLLPILGVSHDEQPEPAATGDDAF